MGLITDETARHRSAQRRIREWSERRLRAALPWWQRWTWADALTLTCLALAAVLVGWVVLVATGAVR